MGSLRNLRTESYLDKQHDRYVARQRKLFPLLKKAVDNNDPDLLLKALSLGVDANFIDTDDAFSTFTWCYESGADKLIAPLIKHGNLDLSLQDNAEGDTPLHRAAGMADYKTVKKLIKMGADLTIKNKRGRTPLDEVRANLGCRFDLTDRMDRMSLRHYKLCEKILMEAET
jgi:ankyrin repeat protein